MDPVTAMTASEERDAIFQVCHFFEVFYKLWSWLPSISRRLSLSDMTLIQFLFSCSSFVSIFSLYQNFIHDST
jgi:hypothetical protein